MQYPLYKPFLFLLTLTIPVGASQQATPKEKKLSANKNPRVPKEASAHVNLPDQYGQTPLMLASSEGDTEIVKKLLQRKDIDINLQDKLCGRTALIYASCTEKLEVVQALLEQKYIDVNQQDKDGRTTLMYAVIMKNLEVAQALLAQKDIDVNLQDQDGMTALIYASCIAKLEVVQALLEQKDIDVNLQDQFGKTALILASSEGHTEVVQALLARENIKVNLQDKLYGRTALMWASSEGDTEIVKKLLKRTDIDVNQPDKYGNTALMYVAHKGYKAIVKKLLKRTDIDVNLQDKLYGSTALMLASCKGHKEIIEKLLQKKANPNQPDKDGNTMLYHCIEERFGIPKNNHQTLAWLLDTGVKQYGLCPFILNNKNELLQDLYEEDNADSNEHFKKASQYLHKERGCPDFHQQKENLMIVGRHLARESGCKKTIPSEIDQLIAFYASGHACFPNATLKERQPTKTSTIHT